MLTETENMIYWLNAGLMLGRRPRRWSHIQPTFGRCFVIAGDAVRAIVMTRVETAFFQ